MCCFDHLVNCVRGLACSFGVVNVYNTIQHNVGARSRKLRDDVEVSVSDDTQPDRAIQRLITDDTTDHEWDSRRGRQNAEAPLLYSPISHLLYATALTAQPNVMMDLESSPVHLVDVSIL